MPVESWAGWLTGAETAALGRENPCGMQREELQGGKISVSVDTRRLGKGSCRSLLVRDKRGDKMQIAWRVGAVSSYKARCRIRDRVMEKRKHLERRMLSSLFHAYSLWNLWL